MAQILRDQRLTRPRYQRLYRTACLPDVQERANLLERLRYKWRYHTNDFRCMSAIVRFAEKYCPDMATYIRNRGWW